MPVTDTQPCVNPSHFAAPHHHGERGQAVQHRIEGCPWVCGRTVYAKEEK